MYESINNDIILLMCVKCNNIINVCVMCNNDIINNIININWY